MKEKLDEWESGRGDTLMSDLLLLFSFRQIFYDIHIDTVWRIALSTQMYVWIFIRDLILLATKRIGKIFQTFRMQKLNLLLCNGV